MHTNNGRNLLPEEGPVVRIGGKLTRSGSLARISLAGTVRSTVVGIVLVVNLEDCKSLLARDARVVGALSSLDGFGDLGGFSSFVSRKLER